VTRLVLVTGGAGFIGSHIVRALLARGDRVRVLDDLSTGRLENLSDVRSEVDLHVADVRDAAAVRRACEGVQCVLHQAAVASVPRSLADPVGTHSVNSTGTLELLIAAHAAGAERVVLASSSSVYGDTDELPKIETLCPRPISPYAVSKLSGEQYARVFADHFGLGVAVLRYFNVFGPRQDPGSEYAAVIPKFITTMLDGARPRLFGDGLQTRDFCFVDNVVRANLLASEVSGLTGQVMNVATGQRMTLLELVDLLNDILGTRIAPAHEPARAGDVMHSLADIGEAARVLGYAPTVSFRSGLEQTVAWFRSQRV
jgi:UDP-glucose 4-epimerase